MQKQTFCANNKIFFPDIGDVFAPFPMFATNIFLAYVGWEILNNLYFLILSIDLGLGYSVMMLFSIDSLKQTSFHAGWIDRKSEICTVYYVSQFVQELPLYWCIKESFLYKVTSLQKKMMIKNITYQTYFLWSRWDPKIQKI